MDNNTIIEFIGCSIADERIQNQSAVVIDVRSLDEFSYGVYANFRKYFDKSCLFLYCVCIC